MKGVEFKARSGQCIPGVNKILVGLHQVGIVNLHKAFQDADASGLSDRDALLDLLFEKLREDNHIPAAQQEVYALALWREYMRHCGEDIRGLYTPIDVVLRAAPGEQAAQFDRMLTSAFGEYELKPVLKLEPHPQASKQPEVVIAGEVIYQGEAQRSRLQKAIRTRISGW